MSTLLVQLLDGHRYYSMCIRSLYVTMDSTICRYFGPIVKQRMGIGGVLYECAVLWTSSIPHSAFLYPCSSMYGMTRGKDGERLEDEKIE